MLVLVPISDHTSRYQNLTLALITDNGPIPLTKLPPPMSEREHILLYTRT